MTKTDPSVSIKRPVGLWKTSRRFQKMTCRFMKNNPSFSKSNLSFYEKQPVGWKDIFLPSRWRADFTDFHPIPSLPRARVYAHTTGVFAFLLSQVSHSPSNQLMFKSLTIHLEHCLRFIFCTTTKRSKFEDKKTHSKNKILVHFRRTRWHLWQQKINIAVGRRARTCEREGYAIAPIGH